MALKWISNRPDGSVAPYSKDIVAISGQSVFQLDVPYIMGIGMIDVYVNGVYQQNGVFIEVDETHIKFVDDGYIRDGDVVSIRYKYSNLSLGDIKVVSVYSDLLNIQNPLPNKVALVTSSRKLYIYDAMLGWKELVIPYTTKNVGLIFQYEEQQITNVTDRQFDLQDITYNPNTNGLLVFIDGRKVDPSDYIEVDSQTVLFNEDLPIGSSRIEFLAADTDSWEETFSHTVDYTYTPNSDIAEEIVKVGVNTVRHTTFEYDNVGNINKETVTKGSKTITKVYEYDSLGNLLKVTVNVVS